MRSGDCVLACLVLLLGPPLCVIGQVSSGAGSTSDDRVASESDKGQQETTSVSEAGAGDAWAPLQAGQIVDKPQKSGVPKR